jgi:CHAD domain-containing protein
MALSNEKYVLTNFFIKSIEKAFSAYSKEYKNCIKKFSDESVHDIRVSIRRFISLLKLINSFFPNDYILQLKDILKTQIKSYSSLRDIQVHLEKMNAAIHQFPVLYTFYNNLIKMELELIEQLKSELSDFNITELEGLVLFIKMELKKTIKETEITINEILKTAKQAYMIVLDLYEEADSNDLSTVHKVRLAFKKYRYLMEIIQPLSPNVKFNFAGMKDFQNILGRIQDNVALLKNLGIYIEAQEEIPQEAYEPAINELQSNQMPLLLKEFFAFKENLLTLWSDTYFQPEQV